MDEDDGGRLTAAARERRAHRVAHLEAVAGLHGPELGAGSLLRGFDLDRSVDGNGRLALLDRSDPIVGLHGWRVGRRFSGRLAVPSGRAPAAPGSPSTSMESPPPAAASTLASSPAGAIAGLSGSAAHVEHLGVGDGLRFHAGAALDHRLQRGGGSGSAVATSDPARLPASSSPPTLESTTRVSSPTSGRGSTFAEDENWQPPVRQRQAGEKGRPGFRNRCASEHRSGAPDRGRRGYAAGPVPWARTQGRRRAAPGAEDTAGNSSVLPGDRTRTRPPAPDRYRR